MLKNFLEPSGESSRAWRSTLDNRLGQRIRRARDREGLTQADLADKLGVTSAAISHWEGGRTPNSDNKTKLEEILGDLNPAKRSRTLKSSQESIASAQETEISSFGLWLRNARTKASLSVPELSRNSGVSAPAIYNIESGRIQNPQPATRDKLAKALDQSVPEEVVSETEDEQAIAGLGNLTDFEPHSKQEWPTCSGIYVLYDISQRPVYVGKAKKISGRLSHHINMFWYKDPIVRYASYVEVKDETLRHQLEQTMIKFLKSNAVINKQSSEDFEE